MDATVHQFPPYRKPDPHHGHDDHGHHEDIGFWRKYIFSTDHKIIGIQYGFTALCFLLFGFFLMMLMRWQIAHPGTPVPIIGPLLEKVLGQARRKRRDFARSLQFASARCTGRSWCSWESCRWRSRRSAITSCR